MSQLNHNTVKQNGAVLANAAALTSAVITALGDKNISRTQNGESLTRDQVEQLALARLTHNLAK